MSSLLALVCRSLVVGTLHPRPRTVPPAEISTERRLAVSWKGAFKGVRSPTRLPSGKVAETTAEVKADPVIGKAIETSPFVGS